MDAPRRTCVGTTAPVALGLQPSIRGGARPAVVDEHHAVTDEHVVLDRHAFADEGVRRNLAAATDDRVLLNLDEGADLRVVADPAAVEIDERRVEDRHAGSKDDIGGYRHGDILARTASSS